MSIPTLLSPAQLHEIHGGISWSWLLIIEIPHMIMGSIELFNYIADRWINGCKKIDQQDHFAKLICGFC